MNDSKSPEYSLSKDPGDETQKRYRYQSIYAAIKCLSFLEEKPEVCYMYCEHHEDILAKRVNGSFVGVQVKTKADGKEPFKANDEAIAKSITRFLEHEKNFGNYFCSYVIATNCGFYDSKKISSNLSHVINLAKEENSDNLDDIKLEDLEKHLREFIKQIYKQPFFQSLGVSINDIINDLIKVLRKIQLELSPGLNDIEAKLFNELSKLSTLNELRVDQITSISKLLIEKCTEAASLVNTSLRSAYYSILIDPEKEKECSIIQGKKIIPADILSLIRKVKEDKSLLCPLNHIPLSEMPKGMKKLEAKMAGGGISMLNIDLTKDLKRSAETQLIKWGHKYGFTKGKKTDEQYQHLRLVVRTQCQEAYDLTQVKDNLFGREMLIEVRKRLLSVYDREDTVLPGLRYEHLVGIAAILTEECKIWWSEEFDIDQSNREENI